MIIEKFEEKLKNKSVELEFAESGNIMIIEKKFDEDTGLPLMKPTRETNSKWIADQIEDLERELIPIQNKIASLEALREAVIKKEQEKEAIIAKKQHED